MIGARGLINFNGIDAQIEYLDTESGKECSFKPDILVLNEDKDAEIIEEWVKKLNENNVLVINADERRLYKFLHCCKAGVLTYGFSQKACVTASSVVENEGQTVQVCIMRSFESFAGDRILQQEFTVGLTGTQRNVSEILASVAISLLCGGSRDFL